MSYTSKYTAEQIEDKLTQVFDSTLQTKEIELTSNGTTELTADAGFLGLKSVTVKTNVPQSGGSGGEGGEGNVEYYSIDWDKAKELGYDDNQNFKKQAQTIIASAYVSKIMQGGYTGGGGPAAAFIILGVDKYISQVAFRFPLYALMDGEWKVANNLNEFIVNVNCDEDVLQIFTPITKEEFSNIVLPS